MKNKILQEILKRKEIFKSSPYDMVSAFNREVETEKEYNGRQLLEIIQNADDEKSQEVLIHLDTKQRILIISNRGTNCNPFSYEGIRSLMISHLSAKTTKKFIGNKGLGFRSIISWSDEIEIQSNGLKIIFSRKIANKIYDELISEDVQQEIKKDRNLPDSIKPIPILAIPYVEDSAFNDWTTQISISYKDDFLDDILQQLNELRNEVLLFLNYIEKLTISIDGNEQLSIDKKTLLKKWKIFLKEERLPLHLWDKDNEEEFFNLKIAIQANLENDVKELFSYLPTKIDINLPYILHGTFELNSSRNQLNNSHKNRYLLEKLVELIVETAKKVTEEEVSYKALEMLTYKTKNKILEELEFYQAIDHAKEELNIFPCLDGTYRKKVDVIYSNELSQFVKKMQQEELFKNLLIPIDEDFYQYIKPYHLHSIVEQEKLNALSQSIYTIDDRIEYIYILLNHFSEVKNLLFLVDKNNELISLEEDIFTPPKKDLEIPDFVKIKFIHPELYDGLIQKFNLASRIHNSRELQSKLQQISNLQEYAFLPVLRRIINSTKEELQKEDIDTHRVVIKVVQALYFNYILLPEDIIIPQDIKIQLINQSGSLVEANNLYLSKSYPSGKLTELLFGDVFEKDKFLADVTSYEFKNDSLEDIERFFLWLGVNQYTKYEKVSNDYKYNQFLMNQLKAKPTNVSRFIYDEKKISNFEQIVHSLSPEKIILWILKDAELKNNLEKQYELKYIKTNGYLEYSTYEKVSSFVKYQMVNTKFQDYLVGHDKLSILVNSIYFNFEYQEFEKYSFSKPEIESLMLKLGATEKFELLSIDTVRNILKSMPEKSPEGKQAQLIYKLCIEHFKRNQTPLKIHEILLYAKKGEEKKYFNLNEVFYNGNIKLPKSIADTKAILDFPRRQNTTHVTQFFGIKNLNIIDINVLNQEISLLLTKEFKKFLETIQEYILLYRIENIETDRTIDAELRKLLNLEILLCEKVQYQVDREIFELEMNDYVKSGNQYLIKINSSDSLNKLRNSFDFQETFADIIGLVFDIQETKIFRDMIKEDILYIEKTIRNDIGSDALIRARELLGKTDEYFSFWKTMYSALGLELNVVSDRELFDSVIKQLTIKTPIKEIDYRHLSSYKSCKYIKMLLDELGLDIKDFNRFEPFYKMDFTEYHHLHIKQAFEAHANQFQKFLYAYCLKHNEQKMFNQYKATYNHNENFITQKASENANLKTIEYINVVHEFINVHFNFEGIEATKIDFQLVYDDAASQINVDALNGDQEYLSLLYFSDEFENIKNYINSDQANDKNELSNPSKINLLEQSKSKPIVDIIVKAQNNSYIEKSASTKSIKYNSEHDAQKRLRGKQSEYDVYHRLIEEYGKENVEYVACYDDSLGYDIKYKDLTGFFKYVEVKSYSNGQFYITKNEKEFAQKHIGFYEIFLVGEEIYRISNVDFEDTTQFTIEGNEFIVKYKIEN